MKRLDELVNDIERIEGNFNINDIEVKDPFYVDKTADWLMDSLGSNMIRKYCCKLARHIPRSYLSSLVVTAKENGDNPVKLFCYLAEKRLRQLGVGKKQ